ncbi:MAG: macro domain-containing protein [Deltaproteobacteria bacterium]|nr:macro domain-containing protein [Deltaproteobacteria bacterium]
MVFFQVRRGSVTDVEANVDVLVNASNTIGQLGTGVSAAIRAACGPGFQDVIDSALKPVGGSVEAGDVWITSAGHHARAQLVAHVAVMDYRESSSHPRAPDADRIERGCRNLWRVLDALPYERPLSIGMVALGGGTGALGVRMPTEIAVRTLLEHVVTTPATSIASVVFHGFDLLEYLNVVAALAPLVRLPPGTVSEDVRRFLDDAG